MSATLALCATLAVYAGCTTSDHVLGKVDTRAVCGLRCGPSGACCAAGEECVTDVCRPTCAGTPCGAMGETCCAEDALCLGGECVVAGVSCSGADDCDAASVCEPLVSRCLPQLPRDTCSYIPSEGEIAPVLKWEWNVTNVATTPLVTELNDDNGDGVVTRLDTPDVLVSAVDDIVVAGGGPVVVNPRIVGLSGDDGHVVFEAPTTSSVQLCDFVATPAVGDLDGDGNMELVTFGAFEGCFLGGTHVLVLGTNGEVRALSSALVVPSRVHLADIDGDGSSEIATGSLVLRANGDTLLELKAGSTVNAIVDVTGDGTPEAIATSSANTQVLALDPAAPPLALLWATSLVRNAESAVGYFPALGAVEEGPHIVLADQDTLVVLRGSDGGVLAGPYVFDTATGVGPITLADFDGDGVPEIALAAGGAVRVIDVSSEGELQDLWSMPVETLPTTFGVSAFDFDGNGRAEIVFADDCIVSIRSGADGGDGTGPGSLPIWSASNSAWVAEAYPIVADVDNDGNSDLVVVASTGFSASPLTSCADRGLPAGDALNRGVRVFRDAADNWVRTRPVWNEHGYHVDNVNDDGTIPAHPAASWQTHDTWRVNGAPGEDPFLAADLVVLGLRVDGSSCPLSVELFARLGNNGSMGVGPGVPVAFRRAEDDALLGVGYSTDLLLPGGSRWVSLPLVSPPLDERRRLAFYVVVDDDGEGRFVSSECREDNNASSTGVADCAGPL